jgi:hypothetical protein
MVRQASIERKQVVNGNVTQMLGERCLQMTVDSSGQVLHVTDGSTSHLYGFKPESLLGMPLGRFVDVLQGPQSSAAGLSEMLAVMAERSSMFGNVSWRVGVNGVYDAQAITKLGRVGDLLLAESTVWIAICPLP